MGLLGTIGRVGLGLGTMGLSEAAMGAADLFRGEELGTTGGDLSGGIDYLGDQAGNLLEDHKNLGTTQHRQTPFVPGAPPPIEQQFFGGSPEFAGQMAGLATDRSASADRRAGQAFDAMMTGPSSPAQANYGTASLADAVYGQAFMGTAAEAQAAQANATFGDAYFGDLTQTQEDQRLSDLENAARMGDQTAAMALLREGAEGKAPSAAEMQLRQGLDRSLAAQQSQMGSARGQAALALAGSNAMANQAALSNQYSTEAARLRAEEMQNYRNAYSGLATQMRGQDQSRLGMSNQMNIQNAQWANDMSQFNAHQGQSASLANAGFANDASNLNAQLASQAAMQNAQLATQMSNWNSQRGTDVSMQNANYANMMANSNAGRLTDTSMQNAGYANNMNIANMNAQNSYKTAVGNVGAAYGNMGLGYGNQAMDPYKYNLDAGLKTQELGNQSFWTGQKLAGQSYDNAQNNNTDIIVGNRKTQRDNVNNQYAAAEKLFQTIGGAASGGAKPGGAYP